MTYWDGKLMQGQIYEQQHRWQWTSHIEKRSTVAGAQCAYDCAFGQLTDKHPLSSCLSSWLATLAHKSVFNSWFWCCTNFFFNFDHALTASFSCYHTKIIFDFVEIREMCVPVCLVTVICWWDDLKSAPNDRVLFVGIFLLFRKILLTRCETRTPTGSIHWGEVRIELNTKFPFVIFE